MGKVVSGLFGDSGSKAAAAATAKAEASRIAAEEAAQNMKANYATDLKQENTGTVISGGTADAITTAATEDLLKKKKASGLSAQLGINV